MNLNLFLQYAVPKNFVSHLMGHIASWRAPKFILQPFLKNFVEKSNIDMNEALESDLNAYKSFNDFFTRKLKDNARSLQGEEGSLISPIDGYIEGFDAINNGQLIQAKKHPFTAQTLLADDVDLASRFQNGSFITLYLSPKNYHRVHMPIAGELKQMIYVPGKLFSVAPKVIDAIPNVFANNERVICIFDTAMGKLALVMVGAMMVGSMVTSWHGVVKPGNKIQRYDYEPGKTFARGEEMGYFQFGSTVILVTEEHVNWNDVLQAGDEIRLGELL